MDFHAKTLYVSWLILNVSREIFLRVPLVAPLLGTHSLILRRGATEVESMQYSGSTIGNIRSYQDYKSALDSIYTRVETNTTSKYEAISRLSVPNWRNQNSINPEEDYALQVRQMNQMILDFKNILTEPNSPSIPDYFQYHLHCKVYSSAYEVAGKKLVVASNALGHKVTTDIGIALSNLDSDYPILRQDFDNKLRNGLNHENYLIETNSTGILIHYANVSNSGGTWKIQNFPPIPLLELQKKAIGVTLFLWAALHINAVRYADMVDEILHNAGF